MGLARFCTWRILRSIIKCTMKILNGKELAEFIKARQLKQVRGLRQAEHIVPRLAIIKADDNNRVIDTYVWLKRAYAEDILIETNIYTESVETMRSRLEQLAGDDNVHGIIVQLPLPAMFDTEEILAIIPPSKDVDGLVGDDFTSATPMAINWLLTGYGVELAGKKIAIVGRGKLVGAPLEKMWHEAGYNITSFEKNDGQDLKQQLPEYDVVITATGTPGLVNSAMLKPGTVVVDAGTASERGVIKGDLSDDAYARDDLTITPPRGGVGPLTVAALFDNVILAARRQAEARKRI